MAKKPEKKMYLWKQWHKKLIELVMTPQTDITTTRGISTDSTKPWKHIKVKHGIYITEDPEEIAFLDGHVNRVENRDHMHNRAFRELEEEEVKRVNEYIDMKIPHEKMAKQLDLEMKTLRGRQKLTVA